MFVARERVCWYRSPRFEFEFIRSKARINIRIIIIIIIVLLGKNILTNIPRNISSLAYRLSLNSLKTKYCKNIACICKNKLTVKHILNPCNIIKTILPVELSVTDNLEYNTFVLAVAKALIYSPIGQLL